MSNCNICGCAKTKKAKVCLSINEDLRKKVELYPINMSKVLEYKLCELVGRFEGSRKS
jgi:hypothetical protein